MTTLLEMREITKVFPGVKALDRVSLTVEAGEVHGFLGPNGAGKSTTIRVLLGLLRADSGSARVLGMDPWDDAVALHRELAYVPGDVNLWPNLTGGEVIDLLGRLRGGLDKARRAELLQRFDLDPSKKCRTYSKGNRQKVALVAALAGRADLYLLDEPTSGLDPLMEVVFQDCVARLRDEGRTVLLSSHITSDLEKVADYITFIHAGKIVFSKTKDDILEQYGVVKCEKARAAALDGAHILGRRDSKFDAELLVDNRPEVARLYPGILTEQATIDDIMTFFAKGAYDA